MWFNFLFYAIFSPFKIRALHTSWNSITKKSTQVLSSFQWFFFAKNESENMKKGRKNHVRLKKKRANRANGKKEKKRGRKTVASAFEKFILISTNSIHSLLFDNSPTPKHMPVHRHTKDTQKTHTTKTVSHQLRLKCDFFF